MRVLITGISGQVGSILADLYLNQGDEVFGIVRRNSVPENQTTRLDHIEHRLRLYYGDVTDAASIERAISDCLPDRVINTAGQSHVRISFDVPAYTVAVNALGALNVLDATRAIAPKARFVQLSSSEMFGYSVDDDGFQRLTTPMNPTSPYGCSKLFAYQYVRHVRRAYGMHCLSGVMFNMESERRARNFVTAKVVRGAMDILNGKRSKLRLGAIDSKRDWNCAWDSARALMQMLEYPEPREWLIASGQTNSVRDLCEYVFGSLGLDYTKHVEWNATEYLRPEELTYLRGDATESREILGWNPCYTFEQTIDRILDYWRSSGNA